MNDQHRLAARMLGAPAKDPLLERRPAADEERLPDHKPVFKRLYAYIQGLMKRDGEDKEDRGMHADDLKEFKKMERLLNAGQIAAARKVWAKMDTAPAEYFYEPQVRGGEFAGALADWGRPAWQRDSVEEPEGGLDEGRLDYLTMTRKMTKELHGQPEQLVNAAGHLLSYAAEHYGGEPEAASTDPKKYTAFGKVLFALSQKVLDAGNKARVEYNRFLDKK